MHRFVNGIKGPAPHPCESCPYRRDVPSGIWAAEEYERLRRYDEPTYSQPGGLFQCHQNDASSSRARLCAGWVACHGDGLLALRIAISAGRVEPEVMSYTTSTPVFRTGSEAAAHGMRDIGNPSRPARDLVGKISTKRGDIETL